jgi:6-phosphogluconolactonase
LIDEAAALFVHLAGQAIAAHGRFTVALSGGSTPAALYTAFTRPPHNEQIEWSKVHIFWGDERFVPRNHPDSSYRMARETLLDQVPIPARNVYPMVAEDQAWPTDGRTEVIQAAQRYEQVIRDFFAPGSSQFDLILLGMGPDGHTASLFPGQPAVVNPPDTWVTAVFDAPKPPPTRLTMCYTLINQARNIVFLITGSEKAAMMGRVLASETTPASYPAQGVRPGNGRLLWLLDEAAAREWQSGRRGEGKTRRRGERETRRQGEEDGYGDSL